MVKKMGAEMNLLLAKQNEEGDDVINRYKLNYYIIKILINILCPSYFFRYIETESESEEEGISPKVESVKTIASNDEATS